MRARTNFDFFFFFTNLIFFIIFIIEKLYNFFYYFELQRSANRIIEDKYKQMIFGIWDLITSADRCVFGKNTRMTSLISDVKDLT